MVAHSPQNSSPPSARIHASPAADSSPQSQAKSPPQTAAQTGPQPDPQPANLPPETHAPDFNPRDPRVIQGILNLFTDPNLSLRDIAEQNNTTLQALTLWLARHEIAEQLIEIEAASARRARFNISFALPRIAQALSQSLDQAVAEAAHLDRLANNVPCFTLRLRYRECIRKSVAHLLRISNFDPTAKNRAENDRRLRAAQTARWRKQVGLSILDNQEDPPDPDSESDSDSDAPQSEFPVPSSPSSIPQSEIPNPKSPSYMIISADSEGRTNIRGLRIPPELNQPGNAFTPVFDPFVPSDPSVPFPQTLSPDEDPENAGDSDSSDSGSDFDVRNLSILNTRIMAAIGLLDPDVSDVEAAHAMFMIEKTIYKLGEELRDLPFDQIVEKVGEHAFEGAEETPDPADSSEHSDPPKHIAPLAPTG